MVEIYKDIEGYEGLYQISNLRNVKSLNYNHTGIERIMKQQKNRQGYLRVRLWKDGKHKHYFIHRLVANTFIPNLKNYPEVNHLDENKENNCIENLEWCDHLYNNNFGTRNERAGKSLNRPIKCVETGTLYTSTKEAHEKTGILACSICNCINGRTKTAGRYHWIKV